jgi:hypothetical protein
MAIDHPVIIYDINNIRKLGGNYIQIMPTNYCGGDNIINNFIEKIGNINKIKEYFELKNKINKNNGIRRYVA